MRSSELSISEHLFSNKVLLIRIGIYGILLFGIYFSSYQWLISRDWIKDDYSASALIPLVVLYLIWEKRMEIPRFPSLPSWFGLALILSGIFLFWLGELGGEFFTQYISSWLLLVGLCWLHLGWKKIRVIAFPLCLLLAMFPLPNFIHGKISFKLKLISSQLGVDLMQWIGMSAYREGNVIDLGFTQLQVIDACSGLRYLIPLIIIGLIISYFYKTIWWKRALLVLSTIPIAVLVNSLRIASVGVLYQFWGPMVAEGFFHDFSGWFIFMLTVGMLVLFMLFLKQLPPKKYSELKPAEAITTVQLKTQIIEIKENKNIQSVPKKITNYLGTSEKEQPSFSPHFLAGCCLLGMTLAISIGIDFNEKIPVNRPLSDFPLAVSGWEGGQLTMEQEVINELDLNDYLISDFKDDNGRSVNLYVAYYERQRKGESIHSPASCMPAGGWVFRKSGKTLVQLKNRDTPFPVNRAFMQKGESKQLSFFWFPMRGRILTNAYEMKIYNFLDALTRQRTDGALVRLITPIFEDETVETAEARLQGFMEDIVPLLDGFLPK